MIERLLEISWGSIFLVIAAWIAAFAIGFVFFVRSPLQEKEKASDTLITLQERLNESDAPQEKDIALPNPTQTEITVAIESAAKRSGMTIGDITFVDQRVEVSSEDSPENVSRFAKEVSSKVDLGPQFSVSEPGIFASSINGELLPQSVVVIEVLREFTR